ncbi:MAG TPA: RES family NAD+ phosphorylase [Candidatus Limnocylindrales bacterium]|nr:RES family NAD+ phosphorylase [Candidatus Limnocylindrales bacterium]
MTGADRLPLLAWDQPLYCHAPTSEPFDPGALTSGRDGGDRWSRAGEPTAYLAGDAGVALAELARHHPPGGTRVERRIMRLQPRPRGVSGLVDLRDPAILRALQVPEDPRRFLHAEAARRVAAEVRLDPRHRGLIVPSMAFLDHPDRPNVVLFGERFDEGLRGILDEWREVARIEVGGP